ncbi:MAG: site-2 protease family protein, partial [Microscillaceae bacterium]|nr:site-2 protease family protein [Microscillaceae bacterium]
FLGVYHPAARYDRPLSWPRQVLGWLALLIFVLSFSPQPIIGG